MEKTPGKVKISSDNLVALFEPKAVAVIGASRRSESVGYAILKNLKKDGFTGKIFPVNPKADEICGINCYKTVNDIPEPFDLAVIIIPSRFVPETLEICGKKGVRSAIVISAGFREVGGEGINLEKQVSEIAKKYNMPVLGPNCLGNLNTDPKISLNASFSRTMPRPGNIAFISQSGALCTAILDYAKGENIGFSKFISLGNKADITELKLLQYLKDDPKTDVILMYVEDLVDGRAFINAAREITGDQAKTIPILAIKSGRTPQGAKAASSHTGSLMGSDKVYDAIFAQAGVLRIDSVHELFDLATAFAYQPIPKGNRVAIITNAGGPGIMTTDACVRYGLQMAQFSTSTVEKLKEVLPPTANFSNPVDVIGDAQQNRYEHAIQCVVDDPNVDSVIVLLTPQAMTDIEGTAETIVKFGKKSGKTILACFMGSSDITPGVKILEENRIPQYKFPEEPARALAAMDEYKKWVDRPRTKEKKFEVDRESIKRVIDKAKQNNQKFLTIDQSMEVFKAYGFPILPFGFAKSVKEAVEQAKKIEFPVAMKIVSPQVVHKVDVGGVRLNLTSEKDVEQAYEDMLEKIGRSGNVPIEGVFIQAMSKPGREVILGMNHDPHFGPILMFGLGGIYVEAFKDVTFRVAPIRELTATCMIENIRAYPLLKGIRGEKPADLEAIADCLERLSQLACEQTDISEIDINPLLVYGKGEGASVIDARIILK